MSAVSIVLLCTHMGLNSNNRLNNRLLALSKEITSSLFITNNAFLFKEAASEIMNNFDLRHISPRQITDMSEQLFKADVINFEEHLSLSFQPELNKLHYEAMTGEKAKPDEPRDFIKLWQDKLDEQLRQGVEEEFHIKSKQILTLLKNLDAV